MKKNKEITFRCDCGYPGFLCFDRDDFYGKGAILVEVIDIPVHLTRRIKNALIYIFKGGKLYYKDIILGKKDVKKLGVFLSDIKK